MPPEVEAAATAARFSLYTAATDDAAAAYDAFIAQHERLRDAPWTEYKNKKVVVGVKLALQVPLKAAQEGAAKTARAFAANVGAACGMRGR